MNILGVILAHKMTRNHSNQLRSSWNYIQLCFAVVLMYIQQNLLGILHILSTNDANRDTAAFFIRVSRCQLVTSTKIFQGLGVFRSLWFHFLSYINNPYAKIQLSTDLLHPSNDIFLMLSDYKRKPMKRCIQGQ